MKKQKSKLIIVLIGLATLVGCGNNTYQDEPELEVRASCGDNKCELSATVDEAIEHYKAGTLVNTKHIEYDKSKYKNDKVTYNWNLKSADPSGQYLDGTNEKMQDVDYKFSNSDKQYDVKVTSNIENVTNNDGISKVIPVTPSTKAKIDFSLECKDMACNVDASETSTKLGIKKITWSTAGKSTIENLDSSNKTAKITFLEPSESGYDIKLQITDNAGLKHHITLNTGAIVKPKPTKELDLEDSSYMGGYSINMPIDEGVLKDVMFKDAKINISVSYVSEKDSESKCIVSGIGGNKNVSFSNFSFTKELQFAQNYKYNFANIVCTNGDADLNVNVNYTVDGNTSNYKGSYSQTLHVNKFG